MFDIRDHGGIFSGNKKVEFSVNGTLALLGANTTTKLITSTSYTTFSTLNTILKGTLRLEVMFDTSGNTTTSGASTMQVLKNGVQIIYQQNLTQNTMTYSFDIDVKPGDTLLVQFKAYSGSMTFYAKSAKWLSSVIPYSIS